MNIPPFGNMVFATSLSGSTGANLYKNTTGKEWVIKKSKKGQGGFAQVKIEATANDIYQVLGVPVPKHILDVENKALILEYINGKTLNEATKEERAKAKEELQKGFVVDALLANWDVIGLLEDNILLPSDGSPAVRVDNGGSLTFRATGGKKKLSKAVTELDTMRNISIAPQAAAYFGDLTDAEIDTQIKTIIVPKYEEILSLTPDDIKETMKARLDYLIERTAWVNAPPFKNVVTETSVPEYIPQVQAALVNFFRDGWSINYKYLINPPNNSDESLLKFLNMVLKNTGAIISGRFILKAIGSFVDESSVDIDIYVPTKNAEHLRVIMKYLFNSINIKKYFASDSPKFSFKKNGIVSISKYSKSIPEYAEMDIMEVNSDRTPVDIVKNFDLTFCENWYDGTNVYMTYPEHVKTKKGFLENHYLNILYTGNPVLLNRIKKYIKRGFRVSINNPDTKKPEDITDSIVNDTFMYQQIKNEPNVVAVDIHGPPARKYAIYNNYNKNSIPDTSKKYIKQPKFTFNTSKINVSKISDHINEVPSSTHTLTLFNYTKSINTPYNLKKPFNSTILSAEDKIFIRYYTASGFTIINNFLYGNVLEYICDKIVHTILETKFPINSGEKLYKYDNRLVYYYCVNLYNAIQKVPKIVVTPFKVYRGVSTMYLKEVSDKFYYINSFTSTSFDYMTAKSFGTIKNNKNTPYQVYIFLAHPQCTYMNISSISSHEYEDEILFTPYHRYFYVGTKLNGSTLEKTFVLLPTDLHIPQTYEEFMPWKKTIADMTSDKPTTEPNQKGGRMNLTTMRNQNTPFFNRNTIRFTKTNNQKMTAKKRNIRSGTPYITQRKMNTTRKASNTKVESNIVEMESKNVQKTTSEKDRIQRMTDPIPSFPGKPPTPAEMDVIKQIVEFFNKEKKQ